MDMLQTEVFEKPSVVTDMAGRIKALPFSQIVHETIFSIRYHDDEFR